MLEVKNLHKSFDKNEVLRGVDFKVEKGEVIAVLGSSGSGKTTLLRCISFLEKSDQGEIIFDDFRKEITKVTNKEIRGLRMKMGFVFQGYHLFRNKTALENVMIGQTVARKIPSTEAKATALQMLERLECSIGQITTRISFRAVSNSGWQSQEQWLPTRK